MFIGKLKSIASKLLLDRLVRLSVLSFVIFTGGGFAQNNPGNELTELKIDVRKPLKLSGAESSSAESLKNKAVTAQTYATLPISKVPILEAGETLVIKFCPDCKGRKLEDLGFTKLIVFFVNPASVQADFNRSFEKAFREIELDTKSKKNKPRLYKEHEFLVPYRSIPLIFFVSGGDYRHDLKKIVIEKQADVIKLGEQSNVLIDLPQAVQYLAQIKEVLNTPAAYNTRIAQSLLQRAQYFRLDRANCFSQPLYRDDRDKLECLAKNFNAAEFEKDLSALSFNKYGRLAGQEAVAQLRNKYDGLNVFFDAAAAVIELVGALFKKKPLSVQIGSIMPSQNDYLSLRQIPVNLQANTERALLLAPLKWREKEEILTGKMLNFVDFLPERECLQPGKNNFWLETSNPLVKREIGKISIELKNASDSQQKQSFAEIPVNQGDGSVSLNLDETAWRKIKDWQNISGKAVIKYNFETIEKEFDVKILPAAKWQILGGSGEPLRRGETSVLTITPNTVRRDCLDKVVIKDSKNQEIQLLPLRGFRMEASGVIKLTLTAQEKEKLQPGKLSINIYENDSETSSGRLTAELLEKKPRYQLVAYSGDNYLEIKGERFDEIKTLTVDNQKAEFDQKSGRIIMRNPISDTALPVNITLSAGDAISQTINVLPSRPHISGDLACLPNDNQSRLIIEKKSVYQPYELPDCVYPTDTDEIKFVLVAGADYSFSFAGKPAVIIGFSKIGSPPALNAADKPPILNAASIEVLSPQRLDIAAKLDQKSKDLLEDGFRPFLKIIDPTRGESDWYPFKTKFLKLPVQLKLDCPSVKKAADGNSNVSAATPSLIPPCELSGDLHMVETVFVRAESGAELVYPVNITSDNLIISAFPHNSSLLVKLRGDELKIKISPAELSNAAAANAPQGK